MENTLNNTLPKLIHIDNTGQELVAHTCNPSFLEGRKRIVV
jgi:hypothetical protein